MSPAANEDVRRLRCCALAFEDEVHGWPGIPRTSLATAQSAAGARAIAPAGCPVPVRCGQIRCGRSRRPVTGLRCRMSPCTLHRPAMLPGHRVCSLPTDSFAGRKFRVERSGSAEAEIGRMCLAHDGQGWRCRRTRYPAGWRQIRRTVAVAGVGCRPSRNWLACRRWCQHPHACWRELNSWIADPTPVTTCSGLRQLTVLLTGLNETPRA